MLVTWGRGQQMSGLPKLHRRRCKIRKYSWLDYSIDHISALTLMLLLTYIFSVAALAATTDLGFFGI